MSNTEEPDNQSGGRPDPDDNQYPYDQYLRFREVLVQLGLEQLRSFDKNVLALASGALALSLIILDQVHRPSACSTVYLYFSWGALTLCLLVTLVSFLIAKMACDTEIDKWDRYIQSQGSEVLNTSNSFSKATTILNFVSGCLFIIGVIFLFLFAAVNVGHYNRVQL